MPTYYATGVTCTLAICELKSAVSNVIDFQCGREQHTDAERMTSALDGATPLSERGVRGEGANNSDVQFLGMSADLPMKMVIASLRGDLDEEEDPDQPNVDETMTATNSMLVADANPSSDIGSPLTSLGATSTPTQLTLSTSPLKVIAGDGQARKQITVPKTTIPSIQNLPPLNYIMGPQGLILNIALTTKSFMPVESEGARRKVYDNKDLKVEVFMNGELVEVDFVSGRKVSSRSPTLSLRYTGKRIHRQIEKPWAYVPPQLNTVAVQDAGERWSAISEALQHESQLRGRDGYGDVSPSAEYLMALSQIALPDRIKYSKGIGVIDIIITAGKGQKYGSEVEYLTDPTRMDDMAYNTSNPIVDPEILFEPALTRSSQSLFVSERESSPEIPLAQVRTRNAAFVLTTPQARSEKTMAELKQSLNLDVNLQKTRIDGFENARGEGNGKGRSLTQRLGDIKKMSPQKQQTELEALRTEFGPRKATEEPARKKLKITVSENEPGRREDASSDGLPSFAADETMAADGIFKPATPTDLIVQTLSQATEVDHLNQSHMELARRLDADPQVYLMQQIASSASPAQQATAPPEAKPLDTPRKRTKASALANSPAHVPVKIPKSYNKKQAQRSVGEEYDDTPIPFALDGPTMNAWKATKAQRLAQKASMVLSDGSPSRGAGRSSKAWYPNERTAAEALAEFEVPALSVGSCVTYAPDLGVAGGGGAAVGGKVRRQCMKARKGEFREVEVVVGVRFCVV